MPFEPFVCSSALLSEPFAPRASRRTARAGARRENETPYRSQVAAQGAAVAAGVVMKPACGAGPDTASCFTDVEVRPCGLPAPHASPRALPRACGLVGRLADAPRTFFLGAAGSLVE
jgi:hypothetical protein